jgi:hypothetical protein
VKQDGLLGLVEELAGVAGLRLEINLDVGHGRLNQIDVVLRCGREPGPCAAGHEQTNDEVLSVPDHSNSIHDPCTNLHLVQELPQSQY